MKKLLLLSMMIFGMMIANLNAGSLEEFSAQASTKVKELVKENNLKVVDYNYVKNAVGKGTRDAAKAIILDARPLKLYEAGHIPSARYLPDNKFDELYESVLNTVSKDKELILYCGGYDCAKSPNLALMLMKKGHKNIKIYAAGMPQWSKRNYDEIELLIAYAMYENRKALFIDTRMFSLFEKGTVLGAINIPDTKFKEFTGFLPANVKTPIITFCAGYECTKSHNVANYLISMGYQNVKVLASGFPSWKKASYPSTGAAVIKKEVVVPMKEVATFLKKGEDTGTVDGDWFVKNHTSFPKDIVIVDVRGADEYKAGHIKGAININAEKLKPEALLNALPEKGEIVFYCGTGSRATEAWGMLAQELKYEDIHRIFYLDANIKCSEKNECTIEVNEPLGV
ncbi:MAG: rhodanese-like domain-containing protein [Arcobacteraceae bacterium]